MSTLITKYGEWVYRAIMLVALAAFWIGSSRESYATKEDVAHLSNQVQALDKTVGIVIEQNKINARQDDQLRDFELRMRALERRP